jgi:hypothetical protein
LLTQLPGYVEGKVAGEDCSKCVGKYLVPKATSVPSGKSAVEVIKHSDGIPTADSNPNRLTIVFSRDGTIAAAIWD